MPTDFKKRIAIIGSGIAGLGCAYFLNNDYDITVFEKNDYVGGHTNTITVNEDGTPIPIDTGFMVFNQQTYPNLLRLFAELDVAYKNTDMSFSVNHRGEKLEWNGAGLNKLFAQRRNVLSPRFWRLLMEMDAFNKHALSDFKDPQYASDTVADYIAKKGFGTDFLDLFMVPLTGAIWSSTPEQVKGFPIWTLMRFFYNHGFLGLRGHYQWYTVDQGAQSYVKKMIPPFQDCIRLNCPVISVRQYDESAEVSLENGTVETFDKVILAAHGDQTRRLLQNPNHSQRQLLQPFEYENNIALLHTDSNVMPRKNRAWGAWNYRIEPDTNGKLQSSTHYWMNQLQGLSDKRQYFVSINGQHCVDPRKVLKEIKYEHPIFTLEAIEAQKKLMTLNQQSQNQSVYFCGSYFKYGFHEDAFTSALELSRILASNPVW